jgi:hypothetical protein
VRLFRIYSFEYGTLFVVRLVLFRGSGISLPKGMVRTNTRSDANPFSATIDSFVVVFQHWFAYRQGSRRCSLSRALCSLPKLLIWSSINLHPTKSFRLQKQPYETKFIQHGFRKDTWKIRQGK